MVDRAKWRERKMGRHSKESPISLRLNDDDYIYMCVCMCVWFDKVISRFFSLIIAQPRKSPFPSPVVFEKNSTLNDRSSVCLCHTKAIFQVSSKKQSKMIGCCTDRRFFSEFPFHQVSSVFIIIIIIITRDQHGYPWPSLATSPYRPLFPVGLQVYIP